MFSAFRLIKDQLGADFMGFLRNTAVSEACSGVEIGPDRYWLNWYRSHVLRGSRRAAAFWDPLLDPREFLAELPPDWDRYCSQRGYPIGSHPILFRVLLDRERYTPAANNPDSQPSHFGEYPVVYERRDKCVALRSSVRLGGGIAVRSSLRPGYGTAGGMLRDQMTSTLYIVSCAHVLGAVNDNVHLASNGQHIGTVRLSVLPPANAMNVACNRRASVPTDSLDLALADVQMPSPLSSTPIPTPVDFITPIASMRSGDVLMMVGARSRRIAMEVGDETLFREIIVDGAPRCFGDVFTLTPVGRWYLNTQLSQAGDSGAWLVRSQGGSIGWDGILFAGDGAKAYACYAEIAFDRCRTNLSGSLVLSP